MKKRNVESLKPRKFLKRPKLGEKLYGRVLLGIYRHLDVLLKHYGSFVYLKFFLVWLLVIAADFLFEFRFEYLWPFWLLLRSVYDSFRYQGMAFSVLFVCMTLTSDVICLLFIPVDWLFFAASTYVWVQFVWHSEKGICMPSIALWALFIYMEALVRLKDVKSAPFHLDLCRPFAAHCIGYPVVTLGFGFKSYVGFRLRQRKQREVAKENEFYVQLLQEALPLHMQNIHKKPPKPVVEPITTNGDLKIQKHTSNNYSERSLSACNGSATGSESRAAAHAQTNGHGNVSVPKTKNTKGSLNHKEDISNIQINLEYVQKKGCGWVSSLHKAFNLHVADPLSWASFKSINDYDESAAERDKSAKSLSSSSSSSPADSTSSCSSNGVVAVRNASPSTTATAAAVINEAAQGAAPTDRRKSSTSSANSNQSNGCAKYSVSGAPPNNIKENTSPPATDGVKKTKNNKDTNKNDSAKDDAAAVTIIRLESDVKRLKADLQSSRQTEQELRNQVNTLITAEKASQQQLAQLHNDNDNLQNKLHNLVTGRQSDRSAMASLEKKIAEEKRLRIAAETQLAQLQKKNRKLEEQNQASAQALQQAKSECSESCRLRRGEIDAEMKQLRREQRSIEEQMRTLERENLSLRQDKESQADRELLMNALSAMGDKNENLQKLLHSETKIKRELFSALGETKRQLEITERDVSSKKEEVENLKAKITEVVAVCPPSFGPSGRQDSTARFYGSKILSQVSSPPIDCTNDFGSVLSAVNNNSSVSCADLPLLDNGRNDLDALSLSFGLTSPLSSLSNLDPNARVYTPKSAASPP